MSKLLIVGFFVVIVIIFLMFRNTFENFENNKLIFLQNDIDELKRIIGDAHTNYIIYMSDNDIDNIIQIFNKSQENKEIAKRFVEYDGAIKNMKQTYTGMDFSKLYWDLRGLLTSDKNELRNGIIKEIMYSDIISKLKNRNMLSRQLQQKMSYKIPTKMIAYMIKNYDLKTKKFSNDVLEMINNEFSSLDNI